MSRLRILYILHSYSPRFSTNPTWKWCVFYSKSAKKRSLFKIKNKAALFKTCGISKCKRNTAFMLIEGKKLPNWTLAAGFAMVQIPFGNGICREPWSLRGVCSKVASPELKEDKNNHFTLTSRGFYYTSSFQQFYYI